MGSNPIIRSNFFIAKDPHKFWWCAGLYDGPYRKTCPPYCKTVTGNIFICSGEAHRTIILHGRRYRFSQACPALLFNDLVFILWNLGGLIPTVSRTCRHLSYVEWYNANQVSSSKHSNIRWRIRLPCLFLRIEIPIAKMRVATGFRGDPTGAFYAGRVQRIPKRPQHPVTRFAGNHDRWTVSLTWALPLHRQINKNFASYFVLRTYREPYDHDGKPCTRQHKRNKIVFSVRLHDDTTQSPKQACKLTDEHCQS